MNGLLRALQAGTLSRLEQETRGEGLDAVNYIADALDALADVDEALGFAKRKMTGAARVLD